MFQVLGCLRGLNIGAVEDFPGKGRTLGAEGRLSGCLYVRVSLRALPHSPRTQCARRRVKRLSKKQKRFSPPGIVGQGLTPN